MDYVKDWRATFKEFHLVLKHGWGKLVFSVEHPYIKHAMITEQPVITLKLSWWSIPGGGLESLSMFLPTAAH